ncbi:tRNA guanosine(34) transglycosylase Tgt [Patescibacteria group bacterium]|nr:tRNA guanosine(34) transglycosylase Tgt [Patescibacteria group bacterium]
MFNLLLKSNKSKARIGKLITAHGSIDSPFFMPIATKGAVKGLSPEDIKLLGAQIILSNTYHLFLRPGLAVISSHKGLHKFINWNKPILTDSGGYQVFSLSKKRIVKNNGVEFLSEIDGQKILLTPAKAVKIQKVLGSDIVMVFDECVSYPSNYEQADKAIKRTTRWAKQCKQEFLKNNQDNKQLLFGIVQGSIYKDLRIASARQLMEIGFDGYAIGGLTLGEPINQTYEMINLVEQVLDEQKPRYLMGAGKPEQIFKAVMLGIDMFDCVIPSRNARHGLLYAQISEQIKPSFNKKSYKEIRILNSKYKNNTQPISKYCKCYTCQNYSLSYLRHLFVTKEAFGQRLAVIHNLFFYINLMKNIRQLIKNGDI